MSQKTKTISGQKITLKTGERYLATRPMADGESQTYPVTIESGAKIIMEIPGLSYEQADALVNAFNNGKTSFAGRIW